MKAVLRQGDMDYLCGIYAVLNAFHTLCPAKVGEGLQKELFDIHVDLLADGLPFSKAFSGGIKFKNLKLMVQTIRDHLLRKVGLKFTVSKPTHFSTRNIEKFWEELSSHTEAGGVAIIRLEGQYDHWTVVDKATNARLHLVDSIGLKHLNKSTCALGDDETKNHILKPRQALLLSFS